MLSRPERLPYVLTRPVVLLALALVVHAAGRVASFCGPGEFDSFLYCVSAYEAWQPGATLDQLISEKPAGQVVLTGWCYRLISGPPTRFTLVPVESVFLLVGYAVFWRLCRRLFGARLAASLALLFVVAHQAYAMDEGFNLNECYMALPTAMVVFAQLTMRGPAGRGFVRGVGLGLLLTLKQTAVGLLAVCLVHGCAETLRRRRYREGAWGLAMTLVGLALAVSPVMLFLAVRGWLGAHLRDVVALAGRHGGWMPIGVPAWERIAPLLPMLWWIALGGTAWAVVGVRGPGRDRAPHWRSRFEVRDWSVDSAVTRSSAIVFTWLWLAAEAGLIWVMVKPWSHYYMQIVAPVAVLAGFGITALADRVAAAGLRQRMATWRWIAGATGALVVIAVAPLWAAARIRAGRFDREGEVTRFAEWRSEWSERSMGGFFREIGHGAQQP